MNIDGSVDEKLIRHIASLARIKLDDKEESEFVSQFKEILDMFSQLDSADTSGVEPSFHSVKISDALRNDVEEQCLSNEDALSLTPHKEGNYFKGPRIV